MNMALFSELTAVRSARGGMSASLSFFPVLRFLGEGFFSCSSASSWLSHPGPSSLSLSWTALRFLDGAAFFLAAGAVVSGLALTTAFLALAVAPLTLSATFSSTLMAAATTLLRGDVRGGIVSHEDAHRRGHWRWQGSIAWGIEDSKMVGLG